MNPEVMRQATRILRRHRGESGKPGSRMHKPAMVDNVDRLRAIDGICGECANLRIEFAYQDGKKTVRLGCRAGLSPLELYRKTEYGKNANCEEFSSEK